MAGILSRLFSRQAPEQRASNHYGPIGWGTSLSAGAVNAPLVENLATVTACVGAIASGLACLPAYVYRRDGDSRIEAPNHPVARLIRAPNERQTWCDWVEWAMSQVLLHGNAISAIEYDNAGRPVALNPIPWNAAQVVVLPSGRLAFDLVATRTPWGGTGQPRRYLDSEVFHLRDRSDDGWLGRSRISRAPAVLEAAIGLQDYSAALWRNAATPSGALKLAGNLSQDNFQRIRSQFDQGFTGAHNARRVLILDNGAEWQSLSVSPEDAEVLASRRFTVEELCRLFQVPPPIVQDYSHNTFTNSAQAELWFASRTLLPWCRKLEAEFQRSIFTDPSYSLEIDMSGMTRGSYSERWAANVAAVNAGILTVDEIREQEGYGPRADVAGTGS